MIICVPVGTEYYLKYKGWYVTEDEHDALAWEKGAVIPSRKCYMENISNVPATASRVIWVWKKTEENEWGPVGA